MYAVNCLLLAHIKTRQMQNDKGIREMSENVNRICLLGCSMRWIVFIVQVVQIYFEMRVLKEGDESFFSN